MFACLSFDSDSVNLIITYTNHTLIASLYFTGVNYLMRPSIYVFLRLSSVKYLFLLARMKRIYCKSGPFYSDQIVSSLLRFPAI